MRLPFKIVMFMIFGAPCAFSQDSVIPAENRSMPKREAINDFSPRAIRLLAAIDAGKPDDVKDLFFPPDAFALLKDIKGAMDYYEKLVSSYSHDISRVNEQFKAKGTLTFTSFKFGSCVWKKIGSEYNKIPYWSCYRNKIVAKDAGKNEITINVKTLINWGNEWYVTHLH